MLCVTGGMEMRRVEERGEEIECVHVCLCRRPSDHVGLMGLL